MIRLDSTAMISVDEFDPLGEPKVVRSTTQSNPFYSFHMPRQTAVPQVAPANGAPSFKGYTSRFDTGSDPFSDLLAFTRTNLGPPAEPDASNSIESKETVNSLSSWTQFD